MVFLKSNILTEQTKLTLNSFFDISQFPRKKCFKFWRNIYNQLFEY